MRFRIPRKVKGGLSFLGLQLFGWLIFIPLVAVAIGAAYLCYQLINIQLAFMVALITIGLGHFFLQTNEQDGTMNISFVFDIIRWTKEKKIIEPIWSEAHDKHVVKFKPLQEERS